MPTGYTAKLCEQEVPFNDFVLSCARAFGALISMKEDGLEVPVPDELKPDQHYREWGDKAQAELVGIKAMTPAECDIAAAKAYEKAVLYNAENARRTAATLDRLTRMRSRVADWRPPTEEHVGMKEFMLEQIDSTIRFDGTAYTQEVERQTGELWRAEQVSRLLRSIQNYTVEQAKEEERVRERNKWLVDLRRSLK
jgi:hypothetical protein